MISHDDALVATRRAVSRTPLVADLVHQLKGQNFQFAGNVMLFGVQHIMDQTLALCWALNELGLSYNRIALCGKAYSLCPKVVEELRALGVILPPLRAYRLTSSQSLDLVEDIRSLAPAVGELRSSLVNPRMLILDDGGQALTHLPSILGPPFLAAGVEQTASGFWQPGILSVALPVIDVGSSAVKRICEPPIIADAALQRAQQRLDAYSGLPRVGVVGLGHIGIALAEILLRGHYPLSLFDIRAGGFGRLRHYVVRSVLEVFERSDVIFGCTGSDITRDLDEDLKTTGLSPRPREFISLSSADDEFYTLKGRLVEARADIAYDVCDIPDLTGHVWGSPVSMPRNGFPINFDNSRRSAPLRYIQGTLAALVGGLCQAAMMFDSRPLASERIILDEALQAWLLRRWRGVLEPRFALQAVGKPLPEAPRPSLLRRLSQARTEPRSVAMATAFAGWTAS